MPPLGYFTTPEAHAGLMAANGMGPPGAAASPMPMQTQDPMAADTDGLIEALIAELMAPQTKPLSQEQPPPEIGGEESGF